MLSNKKYFLFLKLIFKLKTNEFDQVTIWLVDSLIKLRSWQSILGLYEWLSQTVKKSGLEWVLTAFKEAQGR